MYVLTPLLCPAGLDVQGRLQHHQRHQAQQGQDQQGEIAAGEELELGGLEVDSQAVVVQHAQSCGYLENTRVR